MPEMFGGNDDWQTQNAKIPFLSANTFIQFNGTEKKSPRAKGDKGRHKKLHAPVRPSNRGR